MKPIILIITLFLSIPVTAQKMYYPDNSVKVYAGTKELTLAWSGGYDNPQFSMGDLNHDGLNDLVIYEPGKGVKTFINIGVAGNPDYRYVPEYERNFPPVSNYLILADYNCDHIPDLFERGADGFAVHRGYYNAQNQLCFTFYQDLFYNNDVSAGGASNAFCNPGDIPGIADIDGDGDIDFIAYNILGGTINYYRNMQIELGLPCDSIHIELKDRCWGKVYQGFYRQHRLNYSCSNAGLLKTTNDTAAKKTHSGNTPCLFDWDMDGDMDYLDGSVSFNEMTFLKNGRIEYGGHDSMVLQDTLWQTGGKMVSLPTWPAAFNVDIDQDGKKDLLISPNLQDASENYKCIWYYRNLSTPGAPNWVFQSDSFLTDKTIDIGTGAFPMLFDYDMDGKPDLFIGSDGYRQSNGLLKSRISYYKNTSVPGSPSFTLQTNNLLSMDTFSFQGAAPAFGDIDNDGKADMLVGHTDGSITYYKNTAATATALPIWHPMQVTLTDNTGTAINVGGHAAPFIYDIDKDGKKDLLIGNIYGTIAYYQNVSTTPGSVSLKLINPNLGQAKVDPSQVFGCYSTPFVGKIDATGKDYLLVGSNSGRLYRFDSVSCGDSTVTYPMIDTEYAFIDSAYLIVSHPGSYAGVYTNLRSAPTVADIDGDGDYEMIVGDVRGGVQFYKRKLHDDLLVAPQTKENGIINLYPNPAQDMLNIKWDGLQEEKVNLIVTNVQGQVLVATEVVASAGHYNLPLSSYANGLYICILQSGSSKYYNKFVVAK
jgi:hypothetical protein